MTQQITPARRPEGKAPLGAALIIPIMAAGLTIYFLTDTMKLVWEARANGTVIGVALLGLVAAQLVKVVRDLLAGRGSLSLGGLFERSRVQAQRLGLLIVLALFIATIPWVGTTLGLFLTMFTSMAILGVRDLRLLFGISLAVAGTVYGLFIVLLQSRLPVGPVEGLIGPLLGLG